MSRYIYLAGLIVSIFLFGSCGEGILDPGEVSRPLVGIYRLESRTYIAQDSAGTVLSFLTPPEIRSLLTLTREGRYGQIDTVATADTVSIFTETGRWSVLDNQFYIESDEDRFAAEHFVYDCILLVRTLPDLQTLPDQVDGPSKRFSIRDVWRQIARETPCRD